MQYLHNILVISLTLLLHTSQSQWADDVLQSKATCEDKYGFDSCIRSGRCMSDYFIECRCIPRDVRNALGGGTVDGAILCMYSSHVMGTGEPRCCEYYYKRSFNVGKGTHFLNALVDFDEKPAFFKSKDKKDGSFITDLAVAGSFDSLNSLSNAFLDDDYHSETRASPDMTLAHIKPKGETELTDENQAQRIGHGTNEAILNDSDIKNMVLEFILRQRKLETSRKVLKSEIIPRKYRSASDSNDRKRLLDLLL